MFSTRSEYFMKQRMEEENFNKFLRSSSRYGYGCLALVMSFKRFALFTFYSDDLGVFAARQLVWFGSTCLHQSVLCCGISNLVENSREGQTQLSQHSTWFWVENKNIWWSIDVKRRVKNNFPPNGQISMRREIFFVCKFVKEKIEIRSGSKPFVLHLRVNSE